VIGSIVCNYALDIPICRPWRSGDNACTGGLSTGIGDDLLIIKKQTEFNHAEEQQNQYRENYSELYGR
jgi:hypothetical protein